MTVDITGLSNLIKSRRSIRKWQDKPVPEDLLLKALELATHAPNGGNHQNWHFYLILDKAIIGSIADAVETTANTVGSWPELIKLGDAAKRQVRNSGFFRTAPAAIAVTTGQFHSPVDQACAEREKTDPRAAQIRGWRNIADSRVQSAASAIAYLTLILHQMGLGTVWMLGPVQAKREIETILKVPAGMDFVAFLPVGYPAESPEPRPRKPVKEVCEILR